MQPELTDEDASIFQIWYSLLPSKDDVFRFIHNTALLVSHTTYTYSRDIPGRIIRFKRLQFGK